MYSLQSLPLISSSSFHRPAPAKQPRLAEPRDKYPHIHTLSDSLTAVRVLSSCAANRDLRLGSCIHTNILKSGLHTNVFVANSLMDMYAKCGRMEDAAKLFDHMPDKTVVSWTSMMSGHCQRGAFDEVISIFWRMLETLQPNEYTLAVILQACAQKRDLKLVQLIHCHIIKTGFVMDAFLQNSLIDGYTKSGTLVAAEKLMKRLTCRDVVSWTSVISGCVLNGMVDKALLFFFEMQEDGVSPNTVTILSILQACSLINEWQVFQWVHGLVMKAEWRENVFVMNSLVEMYSINGYFKEGFQIFCNFCFEGDGQYLSTETIATLLQGCSHSKCLKLGEQIHGYLIKHGFFPCTIVENSLIYMYAENERDDAAFQLFRKMSCRDIVSWNTMISSLVKGSSSYQALMLLSEVHSNGGSDMIYPDFVTILASIQACSSLASLQLGQVIHGYITRAGLICDIFVQNSLVDMYGKCGRLHLAEKVSEEMPVRDLGSWNSLIAAYGINGNGISALNVFKQLKNTGGHRPNAITFTNILSACAHAGLVAEGFEIFNSMKREYSLEPRIEHFACMVDLLGRAGRLEEAEAFIQKMPFEPGPEVWGALLGGCGLFGDLDIAERVAKKLSILEPKSRAWRVALSNVYASVNKWEDAAKVRAEMRRSEELQKEGGWSSVEVRGEEFRFMVGDTMHPEARMVYAVLKGINEHIRDACRIV